MSGLPWPSALFAVDAGARLLGRGIDRTTLPAEGGSRRADALFVCTLTLSDESPHLAQCCRGQRDCGYDPARVREDQLIIVRQLGDFAIDPDFPYPRLRLRYFGGGDQSSSRLAMIRVLTLYSVEDPSRPPSSMYVRRGSSCARPR